MVTVTPKQYPPLLTLKPQTMADTTIHSRRNIKLLKSWLQRQGGDDGNVGE